MKINSFIKNKLSRWIYTYVHSRLNAFYANKLRNILSLTIILIIYNKEKV